MGHKNKVWMLAITLMLTISITQSVTVTVSVKNSGDQVYLLEKSKNVQIESAGSIDFENLSVEHNSKYTSSNENSSYKINVQGVKSNTKSYEINGVVRANSSVDGIANVYAAPNKAEFENKFEGSGKIEAYASSTKSNAKVNNNDPCEPPKVVGVEDKEEVKVSLDAKGSVRATQIAAYDGLAKAQSTTIIKGSYGYSAAWASKNPDEKGEWLKIKGGWWEYKLWIKGNESAATWAKFTDAGMLNTNLYAEVGNTAKSYGSAFVKDTSKVDYGNAHNGKTDRDVYVTAERIWCGNLDAFVVSHSLNAHSSATLAGIESGDLSSRVKAETGSFTHANFTSESHAYHNEIYSASNGQEYKSKYYWDSWNPWNPGNDKKSVNATGFGYSDSIETQVKLKPSGVGP
ncbi:MAG: hypothetical protein J7K36_11350 [Archaeoglobaceae archaeon]|nr:hypothetical protein [Archaeoglobaceae archaeon]